ncbi:HD domain-containing phosphohydrolase [Vibrio fortis]|uniref:HD domain-containing phosphohydrolase n=1 Tax=Vibrio fortis TaxID=212667 RepID=UPI0005172439|nr:HD domain-containing phosphohydrolase [Vibrio fortis]
MKDAKISLRFTVGGMFLLATILTATVAVSLQYYFSKTMATEHTLSKLTMVSQELSDYVEAIDSDAINTAQLLSSVNRSISSQISKQEARNILSEAIKDNPLFYSIYIGSSNDDFFQIINLDSSPIVREKIDASETDRWVVIEIANSSDGRLRSTSYYDDAFNLRDVVTESSNYFPTTRPWYISASTDVVGKTQPYLFQHLQITGQTYSLAFQSKNDQNSQHVIGIDIVLSSLANKLSATALGLEADSQVESFLYSTSGNIIATNRKREPKSSAFEVKPLYLTSSQQALVSEAGPIQISNQNDWGPMDFSVSGQPNGYAIDMLELISQQTGIEFKYVNGFSWQELTDKFREGELDAIHSTLKNESNGVVGHYSQPLYQLPFSVVTREQDSGTTTYQALVGNKVAILSGWSITEELKRQYPEVELISFPSLKAAFDCVESKACDAVLDVKPVLDFALERFFHSGLRNSAELVDLRQDYASDFYLVLGEEHQALLPIINMALDSITPKQKAALEAKWFHHEAIDSDITVPYTELYELIPSATLEGEMKQIQLNGESRHLYLRKIETGEHYSEYFAVLIPEQEIYQTVHKRVATSIGITVLLMALTLPVAWIFGAPIVRPIRKLQEETLKIKQRRYDDVEMIETRIKEVWDLSVAVKDMANEIKTHEQTQEEFVEAFIKLIAQAIDDKSPYTAGHCNRVPELGMMLAEAVEASDEPLFKDFKFANNDERREFRIAAWLHDCGKITTPEHIVDKGTKLEANYNRIHEVRMRFEVLWRDAEIQALEKQLSQRQTKQESEKELAELQQTLIEDFEFIATSNVGGEYMSDEKVERIHQIANKVWYRHFDDRLGLSPVEELARKGEASTLPAKEQLLSDKPEHIIPRERTAEYDPKLGIRMAVPEHQYNLGEVYNLSIARGTLTAEDRFKINEHMISTIKMLENLPFPKELSRVPRYASTHHETLKGTGYPRKLTAEELSIPERVLVISDIFEALTASDRPYRKAKPISVAVNIMHKMALDEHIDIELFRLFLTSGTHLRYAKAYLKPEQIDSVDIEQYMN